jgi:hypothetical protein
MPVDRSTPGKDELSLTPVEDELHRELIEQFYERSVHRYGIDSEQTRMLSQLLYPLIRTNSCR